MRSKHQGFTLTELLIVVAIVAVMAAIAFPNMSQWIAARRAAGQAEQVANLLRFARGEAVRLNLPVYVCPALIKADGNPDQYCDTAHTGKGMVAFADKNKDGGYTRNTDIDLRTVILNAKSEERAVYEFGIYNISAQKQNNDSIFAFFPDGRFGHAAATGQNNQFTVGTNFVKISVTDANAVSDKDKAARSSVRVVDVSGRVHSCSAKDAGDAGDKKNTVAKLCRYRDEAP